MTKTIDYIGIGAATAVGSVLGLGALLAATTLGLVTITGLTITTIMSGGLVLIPLIPMALCFALGGIIAYMYLTRK